MINLVEHNFYHTRNEQSKNEIEKAIPFTININKNKIPTGINLTKEVKRLVCKKLQKKKTQNLN